MLFDWLSIGFVIPTAAMTQVLVDWHANLVASSPRPLNSDDPWQQAIVFLLVTLSFYIGAHNKLFSTTSSEPINIVSHPLLASSSETQDPFLRFKINVQKHLKISFISINVKQIYLVGRYGMFSRKHSSVYVAENTLQFTAIVTFSLLLKYIKSV